MERVGNIQTAFRFSPELIKRLKTRARLEHKSVNAYVEEVVERALDSGDRHVRLISEINKLRVPSDIPAYINDLSTFKVEISAEEIASDDKLAYILEK